MKSTIERTPQEPKAYSGPRQGHGTRGTGRNRQRAKRDRVEVEIRIAGLESTGYYDDEERSIPEDRAYYRDLAGQDRTQDTTYFEEIPRAHKNNVRTLELAETLSDDGRAAEDYDDPLDELNDELLSTLPLHQLEALTNRILAVEDAKNVNFKASRAPKVPEMGFDAEDEEYLLEKAGAHYDRVRRLLDRHAELVDALAVVQQKLRVHSDHEGFAIDAHRIKTELDAIEQEIRDIIDSNETVPTVGEFGLKTRRQVVRELAEAATLDYAYNENDDPIDSDYGSPMRVQNGHVK